MAGSHFPTATSTHPSQHRFPHQEQPLGSTADCGCPAVQRSHSEGPEWSISQVLQPAVSGAEEDRGSVSRHRAFYIESAPGGAALQNGNIGIYMSSHQDPRMDHILYVRDAYLHVLMHRVFKTYLWFRVNEKTHQFTCLPFRLATSPRSPQASKTHSGVVKTAKCQAAHLLGRLADLGRVSRTGPDACPDDHLINAEARMGYQFREVRSNAEPGLPVSGNALKHLTVRVALLPKMHLKVQSVHQHWMSNPIISAHNLHKLLDVMVFMAMLVHRGRLRLRPIQLWAATAWCPEDQELDRQDHSSSMGSSRGGLLGISGSPARSSLATRKRKSRCSQMRPTRTGEPN